MIYLRLRSMVLMFALLCGLVGYTQQTAKDTRRKFLTGKISINMNVIRCFYPEKGGKRRSEQTRTSISTSFYGRIFESRIKLCTTNPKEYSGCEPENHCPVFDGSTNYVISRDPSTLKITESKEYPLKVYSDYLAQDFK